MAHRWLVLIAAVFVSTVEFGLLFSLSALYIPILETFNTDRATAALIQSVSLGVTMSTGIITGLIVKIVGYRKVSFLGAILSSFGYILSYFADNIVFLIVSLGIISGFGIAFMYVSSTVTVVDYFEDPGKSLALATVQMGVGIAGVFYPYLLIFLFDMYGLQSTFLIIGGVFLNNFAISVLYTKPIPKSTQVRETDDVLSGAGTHTDEYDETTPLLRSDQIKEKSTYSNTNTDFSVKENEWGPHYQDESKESLHYNYKGQAIYEHRDIQSTPFSEKLSRTFIEAFRSFKELVHDKSYILFLIGDSLVVAFANGFIAVVVDIFTSKGFSEDDGLSAFLPYFLASIFGRILPGVLQQSPKINPLILPLGCAILGVAGQLCVLLSSVYIILMVGCCFAGLSVGGAISASSVVAVRLVKQEAFPVAFGLIMSLSGIITAAVAPLNGLIRDKTGSYSLVLVVTAGAQLIGGLLLLIVFILKAQKKSG